MIDIKDINGNIRFSTPINNGSKRKFMLMKEDYITLKFSLDTPLNFKLGDNVDCTFGLFELMELYKPSYNGETGGYDYELRLDAYYWKWRNKIFKFTPELGGQEASWNLTASLTTQMDVFLRNLESLGYTYRGKPFEYIIDSTVDNSARLMSYNNMNMIDALSQMAEAWECEWWLTDSIIHFGRCEYGTPVDLKLGDNVDEMTQSESQNNYATRIYAFGSTKNLPSDYRPIDETTIVNGVVQKRLMLPTGTPYIDAYPGMSTEEAIEDVVVFEDVYPRRTGKISNITLHEYTDKIEEEGKEPVFTKWNAYRFKDPGITFSEKYVLPGQELKIIFQSGLLNGMEFSVIFNPCDKEGGETPIPDRLPDGSFNPVAQVWEICRNEDYGRPLPDNMLIPKEGDTYVLSGFNTEFISGSILSDAEAELKQKAEQYVAKMKVDPSTYTVKMNSDQMISEDGSLKLFEVGDKVKLFNSAYFEVGSRLSRIIGFEYNLDIPYDSPVYTVGETASYSRMGELEGKIDSLIFKQNSIGNGGSGIYVIGTNDGAPATNRNVFSALRSLAEFINKKKDDIVQGVVTFTKKMKSLSGIEFGTFVTDSTGGAIYKDEQENWHFEGDFFHVRKKLETEEIEIQRTTHIGGKLMNTAASMICCKIEEYDTYFRCFFNHEDAEGRKVYCQFEPGDQGFVETFNLQRQTDGKLSNHYLWRLVITVGDDFIDLSKSDCEEASDSPMVGDNIIQLGNRTDKSRQGAIIDASCGSGTPYIRIYKGIDSYTLPKPVIDLNTEQSEICAKFISVATGKSFDDMFKDIQVNLDLIKEQADKEYTLWFFEYDPTLENIPALDWDTDEQKTMHEQDLFYNRTTGYAFRFEKTGDVWTWNSITDQQTIKALENAAKAQDTADGKRCIFVEQPKLENVYEVGDLWTNATYIDDNVEYENDTLVCHTAKAAGEVFSINHWRAANSATTGYLRVMDKQITAVVQKFNDDGKGTLKSGLIAESDFASLFSKQVVENGLVKQADISAFIKKNENGVIESGVKISADQINFIGKTIITGGKFTVDERGNVTMNDAILTGTVTARDGRVAGFKISGNGLTNANDNGTFTNDAYLIFRNDTHGCFAGIGGNILPATAGVRGVARFENHDESDWWGLGKNYAMIVSARGASDNNAIAMLGGYISRLAVKTFAMSSSGTIPVDAVSVVLLSVENVKDIYITLPTMSIYDDGHILKIKRMGGGYPIPHIKAGKSWHHMSSGNDELVDSYIAYDGGYYTAGGRSFTMSTHQVMEFVYHRDLTNEVDNASRYGCWVQMSRTSY